MMIAAEAKEGTIEKARSVIFDTWQVIQEPTTQYSKIKRTAAKVNGAKSKGIPRVWNLFYLHQYIMDVDITKLDFRDLTCNLIVKLRGYLGWRSADLKGLFVEHSFDWNTKALHHPGVNIRAWNLKTKQGQWSQWTFVPEFAEEFRHMCLARTIRLYLERLGSHGETTSIEASGFSNAAGPAIATPLLQYYKTKTRTFKPLAEDTVGNYFKQYFLDNVNRGTKDSHPLSEEYKSHSARNAVASLMAAIKVPLANIAAHMLTSPESLQKTYIRAIDDPSRYPTECIEKHTSLVGKMLTPTIHYITLDSDSGECKCSGFLASNASSV